METYNGIKCTNSSGTFKVENISMFETENCSRYNTTDVWVPPMFNASAKNVLLAIILTTIDVVTIFGNLLVLVAFVVERKLFQPFNMFIFNLAVTDFLVAVTAMTFYTIDTLLGYWPFGYVMCGLWIYFDFAMTFASVFTLVAISIDRFWCVTWAVHYRMYNNKTKTVIILALIWFCVIAIWTPPFIGDRLKHNESHFCIWEPSDNREFVIFVAGVGHYIPCIIMVFCYIKVFTVMRRQVAIVGNIGTPRLGTATTNTPTGSSRSNVANGTNAGENRVTQNAKHGAFLSTSSSSKVYISTNRSNVNQFTSLHYIHAKSKPNGPLQFEGTSSSQNKVMDTSSRPFGGISAVSHGTSFGKSESISAHIGHANSEYDSTNAVAAGSHPSGHIADNPDTAFESNQHRNDSLGDDKAGDSKFTEKTNTVHFLQPQRECSQRAETSNISQHSSRQHLQSGTFSARERKIFITLTYVLSSYLICWFPFYIAFDTYAWNPTVVPADLYTFFFWMTYVNSTLNPFIYAYTSKDFRSAFIKVLSRLCNCFK